MAVATITKVQLHDWLWTRNEEPHKLRRKQILKAHPEVSKLCGPERITKYVVSGVVLLQLACAYLLRNEPFFSRNYWIIAYIVGATSNQNLFMGIHEISHNLAFKKPLPNKLLAIWANIPVGIPFSASFTPYHQLHHKYLGDTTYDADLPTRLEAVLLDNILGKTFFATFQIFFYAIRPMFVTSVKLTLIHLFNIIVQFTADYLIVKFWGWNSMLYLLLSSFLAGSLHPCAGHFFAEHYVFDGLEIAAYDPKTGRSPPETYSYYGPLNIFTYNVGLHNEHHDFPYIPWTRLYKLNRIAREFYDPLPKYYCWSIIIVKFIFDPKVSLWCRVRREAAVKKDVKAAVLEDGIEDSG